MSGEPEVFTRRYKLEDVYGLITSKRTWPYCASHSAKNDAFAGADWPEAWDLFQGGWDAGVPKLDVTAISSLQTNLRPTARWDVSGSEVDVAAYLQGTPECMVEVMRTSRPSPVVRIGVDRSASAYVKASKIEEVGRSVLVLVESLRLAGIPAEVWAVQTVEDMSGGAIFDLQVCVQEPSRPVDVSRLAFWLAHPAALRRIVFAIEECEPNDIRSRFGFGKSSNGRRSPYGGGYGRPMEGYARESFDEFAPGVHVTPEEMQAWATEVLSRRAGI